MYFFILLNVIMCIISILSYLRGFQYWKLRKNMNFENYFNSTHTIHEKKTDKSSNYRLKWQSMSIKDAIEGTTEV